METDKISIIIPVYNAQSVLRRCIDSLRAQTYNNIELIFVDDGSEDDSVSIISNAATIDDRIQFYTEKNKGPSAARNFGIAHATGKYVLFCDADDTVSSKWCETLYRAIQTYLNAWIVCGIQTLDEAGVEISTTQFPRNGLLDKSAYFDMFKQGYTGSVNNKIYDLGCLRRENICFDETRRWGEDVIFCIDYLERMDNIYIIDCPLYQYYRYDTSETLTNCYHSDDYKDLCDLYRRRKDIISADQLDLFQEFYWNKYVDVLNRTMIYNPGSFWERLYLNNLAISTNEFQELLGCCGKRCLNKWALKSLSAKKYIGFYVIQRLHCIKRKLSIK